MFAMLATMIFSPAHARLTDREVDQLLQEILPLVEQAAGRELEPVIPVEVVVSSRFADVVGQEQAVLASLTHPGLPPAQLRLAARRGEILSHLAVAKYALFEHTVFFSAEALEGVTRVMQKDGLPVTEEGLARCVLAHELAHALQAQTGAFERVVASGDAEWLFALNMVAEGHAVQLHEHVCDEAHRGPMRKMLGVETDLTPYGAGAAFLSTQSDPWAVFETPPIDTAMVYLPDRYVPAELPSFAHWETLERTARALIRNASAPLVRARAGYHQLRAAAPTDEALRAALSSLESAHVVESFTDLGQVSVLQAHFRDEASARAYLAALEPLTQRQGGSLPTYLEPPQPVSLGKSQGFRVLSTIRPSDAGTAALRQDQWVLVQGRSVTLATLTNVKPKDKHILAALSQL